VLLSTAMACDASTGPRGEDQGIIRISLAAVPADVACVRLTVANAARTVVRDLPATPGLPIMESLFGMPTGDVSIGAQAFAAVCPAPGAPATWVSDPLMVFLVAGVPLPVQLTMRRNGRIELSIDWVDDTVPPNRMFVTSLQFPGNLGGLVGADARCQLLAQTAGIPGTFVAFLATDGVPADVRLGSARGWVRTDGRPFADTIADVVAGRILYPPLIDENGQLRTESVAVGTAGGANCLNWTNSSLTEIFEGGWSSLSGASFYTGAATLCFAPVSLYCFEVARNVAVAAQAPVPHRLAFLSSDPFVPGGGLAGADLQCGVDAVIAGLPGSYRALLATTGASAISRFDVTGPPWALVNGVLVAETAAALAVDPLAHIDVYADGTHAAELGADAFNDAFAWTGSDRLDTPSPDTCQNWMATGSGIEGAALRLANSAPGWQAGGDGWSTSTFPCSTAAHVFCLQQ
jgi:hypothetical protein